MLDRLYENIGGKIKNWAKWIFVVEAISAIITGVVFLFIDEDFILYGLLIMVLGPIVAWVGSWILYAFGELVEDVHAIRSKDILKILEAKDKPQIKVAPPAPRPVATHSWRCDNCGKMTTQSPCEHCGYAEEKEHSPYWCGNCGHAGPYDDRCPACGSSLKRFNVRQN